MGADMNFKSYLFITLLSIVALSSCITVGKFGEPKGRKIISKQSDVSIERLPDEINTSTLESNAWVDDKEKNIYFSRMTGFLEASIFKSENKNGRWLTPIRMGNPPNSEDQCWMGNISNDGERMVFARNHKFGAGVAGAEKKDNLVNLNQGIFIAKKKGTNWEIEEALDPFVNSQGDGGLLFVSYMNPFLTNDGKRLYFACNPQGIGSGQLDLFYMQKEGNSWSKPINLGNIINSPGDEITPFLTDDGKTLFFASNGHPGIGDYDIYRSYLVNGNWTEPELLGSPINSNERDYGFIVLSDNKTAYFGSARSGGGDVYKTVVPRKQIDGKNVPQFIAIVTDAKTGKPINANVIIKEVGNEENSINGETDKNGRFATQIEKGKKYKIWVSKDAYAFQSLNINTENLSFDLNKEIKLVPIEKGSRLILNNIVFDFDSDKLRPESEEELDKAVKLLQENQGFNIEVQGHTDNVGNEDYNQKLSKRRAESVLNYLVKKGINKKRLTSKGYGASQPIADNSSEEGRQLNRRVELIFK